MDKNLLAEAINHHKLGKLELADGIYSLLLEVDPSNYQLLCLRGSIAQSLNEHGSAIDFFHRADAVVKNNYDVHLHLGISYSRIGDLLRANTHYSKAAELRPSNNEPLVNIGNNLTKLKQFQDAFVVYEQCLTLDSSSASLNYNIGTMFLESMNPDAAVFWLQKAVQLAPNYSSAWNSLGVSYTEIGKLNEALNAYQESASNDPTFFEPLFNMHAIYVDLDSPKKVFDLLLGATKIDPNNYMLHFFLAMAYEYYGHEHEASILFNSISNEKEIDFQISSWNYLKSFNRNTAVLVGTNLKTFEIAIEHAKLSGLVLEFGVYNGKSIRRIAERLTDTVHGFDSFEGIPESWNDEPSGSYSAEGVLPEVPSNVVLHQGWFDDTLPPFVSTHTEPIKLLHIDCDLYSSTKTVFNHLHQQIVPGTVIVFDEFIGYKSWQQDEFKAFTEASSAYSWEYELLTFSFVTKQAALIIK
jgi:tetratricopeptide (TPR) repeat protein